MVFQFLETEEKQIVMILYSLSQSCTALTSTDGKFPQEGT